MYVFLVFSSLLLIRMQEISGASIQVMTTLTALWILLKISLIQYVTLLGGLCITLPSHCSVMYLNMFISKIGVKVKFA